MMLCLFLALLVWFLVGERGGQPAAAPLLESTTGLTPTLRAP